MPFLHLPVIRQRPGAQGDEPQPQQRFLSPHPRSRRAVLPRIALSATSSSASRRERSEFADTLSLVDAVGLFPLIQLKYSPAPAPPRRNGARFVLPK